MPAEGRELHAHIYPRDGNSTNFLIILIRHAEDGAGRFVDVVEIEEGSSIVKVLISVLRRLVLREARSVVMTGEIGSILYRYLISLLQLRVLCSNSIYYLPVLIFHLRLLGSSLLLEPEPIPFLEILSILSEGFNAVCLYPLIERLK